MTVNQWSTTAATNATADSTINAREGMAPSQVNDAMRALMAAIAKWRDDTAGTLTTAGTSTAYTLTTTQGFTALSNGLTVACRMSVANGAAPTLNVDGLGAKAIAGIYGTAIASGRLKANGVYVFVYNATDAKWIVQGAPSYDIPSGTLMLFQQTTPPTGWTKQTTHNNKGLRLVSGTASSGGTSTFTSIFTDRTLTQANLPSYTLPDTFAATTTIASGTTVHRGGTNNTAQTGPNHSIYTDLTLSTLTATTTISGSVTSGGSGTAIDMSLAYVDVTIGSKDA